jgi:hypothetical protein
LHTIFPDRWLWGFFFSSIPAAICHVCRSELLHAATGCVFIVILLGLWQAVNVLVMLGYRLRNARAASVPCTHTVHAVLVVGHFGVAMAIHHSSWATLPGTMVIWGIICFGHGMEEVLP